MYDNYIFDLYGTLVDCRTNEEKPYLWKKMSEIYSSMGAAYTPGELKQRFRQLILEEIDSRTANGEAPEDIEPDLTKAFAMLYIEKGIPCDHNEARLTAITFRTLSRQLLYVYDGIKELFEELHKRGKGVYLLSNAQTDFTRPELDMLGLTPYFDGILISSEQGCKKPSVKFFNKLKEEFGLELSRCIMVGNDSTSDIPGASRAGMDSLYIHTATSPEPKGKVGATYCVMDGDWKKAAEILLQPAAPKK